MAPRTTEVLLGIMESLKGTGTAALGLESDCTESDSEYEIPPWEEDSQFWSDSGKQLSVGEQEWAAELNADLD
ncbi:hypothetical protein WJX82_006274 [Trebouxia sp. C0006]